MMRWVTPIGLALVVSIMLIACGNDRNAVNGRTTTTTSPTTTAAPTATAEITTTPKVEETPTETSTASDVSVSTDKKEYQQDEQIAATITNNLDTSITTFNQQAFCTTIKLERREGTGWNEVGVCLSAAPRSEVTLEPHTETVVTLPALPAGTYRASLVFSIGETFDFGESFVASSEPFSVQ